MSDLDFSHEHARSRTYRWGEDGIAGVSDTHNLQNIAFAFWNEKEYVFHRMSSIAGVGSIGVWMRC